MGVSGLWDVLRPAGKTRSLTELAVTEGFEANPDGVRGFRIGIDASIWFFHAEYGKEGENPVLRTLFFRCATLMRSPFLPLFVFDGPKRPDIKRGKKINKTPNKLIPGMKAIVDAFGFEWRTAPGEAEAELAYLNRIGFIDGILSDDVDNFLFGATTVIRNPSNNLSGNRLNPAVNAAGKDDKNHTRVYRLSDIQTHPDVRLTRGGMILIGLMKGGDYDTGGLARCGTTISHGLAKCGFGDTLLEAARNSSRSDLEEFLVNWRHELRQELRTNSKGHIGKKQPSLAKAVPDDFPDIDILLSYANPITSESMGRSKHALKLTWTKEPDIGKLAATCEFYFEWGYKEAIIKRFRTIIWHPAVLRILRRAVLDKDLSSALLQKTSTSDSQSGSGSETNLTEAPHKMIARHFSSMPLKNNSVDSTVEEEQSLIVKIHSTRNHLSTDGILEHRLEIDPSQLVRIAESGLKGLRSPEEPDEWADEDDDGDSNTRAKKSPPDPTSHLRVWMPACMTEMVVPDLVREFQGRKAAKRTKRLSTMAESRGKVKTFKAASLSELSSSDEGEPLQPVKEPSRDRPATPTKFRNLTRKALHRDTTSTGLKDFFSVSKTQHLNARKPGKISTILDIPNGRSSSPKRALGIGPIQRTSSDSQGGRKHHVSSRQRPARATNRDTHVSESSSIDELPPVETLIETSHRRPVSISSSDGLSDTSFTKSQECAEHTSSSSIHSVTGNRNKLEAMRPTSPCPPPAPPRPPGNAFEMKHGRLHAKDVPGVIEISSDSEAEPLSLSLQPLLLARRRGFMSHVSKDPDSERDKHTHVKPPSKVIDLT